MSYCTTLTFPTHKNNNCQHDFVHVRESMWELIYVEEKKKLNKKDMNINKTIYNEFKSII